MGLNRSFFLSLKQCAGSTGTLIAGQFSLLQERQLKAYLRQVEIQAQRNPRFLTRLRLMRIGLSISSVGGGSLGLSSVVFPAAAAFLAPQNAATVSGSLMTAMFAVGMLTPVLASFADSLGDFQPLMVSLLAISQLGFLLMIAALHLTNLPLFFIGVIMANLGAAAGATPLTTSLVGVYAVLVPSLTATFTGVLFISSLTIPLISGMVIAVAFPFTPTDFTCIYLIAVWNAVCLVATLSLPREWLRPRVLLEEAKLVPPLDTTRKLCTTSLLLAVPRFLKDILSSRYRPFLMLTCTITLASVPFTAMGGSLRYYLEDETSLGDKAAAFMTEWSAPGFLVGAVLTIKYGEWTDRRKDLFYVLIVKIVVLCTFTAALVWTTTPTLLGLLYCAGNFIYLMLPMTVIKASLMTIQLAGNYEHVSRDLMVAVSYPPALASLLEPAHGFLLESFGTSKAASGVEREQYTLWGYRIVYGSLPFVYIFFVVAGLLWVRRRIQIHERQAQKHEEQGATELIRQMAQKAGKQGATELM